MALYNKSTPGRPEGLSVWGSKVNSFCGSFFIAFRPKRRLLGRGGRALLDTNRTLFGNAAQVGEGPVREEW